MVSGAETKDRGRSKNRDGQFEKLAVFIQLPSGRRIIGITFPVLTNTR